MPLKHRMADPSCTFPCLAQRRVSTAQEITLLSAVLKVIKQEHRMKMEKTTTLTCFLSSLLCIIQYEITEMNPPERIQVKSKQLCCPVLKHYPTTRKEAFCSPQTINYSFFSFRKKKSMLFSYPSTCLEPPGSLLQPVVSKY